MKDELKLHVPSNHQKQPSYSHRPPRAPTFHLRFHRIYRLCIRKGKAPTRLRLMQADPSPLKRGTPAHDVSQSFHFQFTLKYLVLMHYYEEYIFQNK